MSCSLCNCPTRTFACVKDRKYVQCTGCKAIFLLSEYYVSPQAEKRRYALHNNDVNDPGYIRFVQPLVERVKSDFNPQAKGLDFGCGTGPVIASELKKCKFQLELYDPYFKHNPEALKYEYDYIICCEVIEHFHQPLKEFMLLKSLLKPGGKLYCKTGVYDESIVFKDWHYKDDVTHVIFYTEKTLGWIQRKLNFSSVNMHKELIVFQS